jgi:hypothetical protein
MPKASRSELLFDAVEFAVLTAYLVTGALAGPDKDMAAVTAARDVVIKRFTKRILHPEKTP